MPESKDWMILAAMLLPFGLTVVVAWARLKVRIDRIDQIDGDVKTILLAVQTSVQEIKTDVAVLVSEQTNLVKRVDRIEDSES